MYCCGKYVRGNVNIMLHRGAENFNLMSGIVNLFINSISSKKNNRIDT